MGPGRVSKAEAAVHDAHGSAEEDARVPKGDPHCGPGRRAGDISGMEELVAAILAHQAHLRKSRALEEVQNRRIEQEFSLIFRDALEKLVSGSEGDRAEEGVHPGDPGRAKRPVLVVDEVLKETLTWNSTRR